MCIDRCFIAIIASALLLWSCHGDGQLSRSFCAEVLITVKQLQCETMITGTIKRLCMRDSVYILVINVACCYSLSKEQCRSLRLFLVITLSVMLFNSTNQVHLSLESTHIFFLSSLYFYFSISLFFSLYCSCFYLISYMSVVELVSILCSLWESRCCCSS